MRGWHYLALTRVSTTRTPSLDTGLLVPCTLRSVTFFPYLNIKFRRASCISVAEPGCVVQRGHLVRTLTIHYDLICFQQLLYDGQVGISTMRILWTIHFGCVSRSR